MGDLFFKVEGEGETILFLPGLCLNHHLFDETAKFLKDRYRLIFVDLYGTGNSPKPKEKYSFKEDIIQVFEIIKNFPSTYVIAHSRGVKIALGLYKHYKHFKKSIFVGQAGFGERDDLFSKNVLEVKKLKLTSKNEIAKILERNLNFGKIYGGTETLQKLKKAKDNCDIVDTLLRRVEDSPNYKEIAKNFHKEVNFVVGERDPFYSDIKDALKIYKNAKIYEIPQSGHFPMIENSEKFNLILNNILQGG